MMMWLCENCGTEMQTIRRNPETGDAEFECPKCGGFFITTNADYHERKSREKGLANVWWSGEPLIEYGDNMQKIEDTVTRFYALLMCCADYPIRLDNYGDIDDLMCSNDYEDTMQGYIELAKERIQFKKREKERPSICIDFDGVLNEYQGWRGSDVLYAPRPGAKEFLKGLSNQYKIIIFTTRDHERVKAWLDHYHMSYDEITSTKVAAVCYVDDRAIPFDGSYLKASSKIRNFKPYWEGEQE